MGWARAAMVLVAVVVAAALLVSGGSSADPRTPAGLPGMPPPFLGVAVIGNGQATAAVDAYGDVVDLRPAPAGAALIDNSARRQAAGTVSSDTGIVPRVAIAGGPFLPFWRADAVTQTYAPGTNVLVTKASFGGVRVAVEEAARGEALALTIRVAPAPGQRTVRAGVAIAVEAPARCRRDRGNRVLALSCTVDGHPSRQNPAGALASASAGDRRWLARARALGDGAPAWATRMYRRSLLVLRALTDSRSGAVAAGARDGWAYVWPRDAATAALAYAAAGYRAEARRTARFLLGLDLEAAARFHGDGNPIPGRGPQGDAAGWVEVAAHAAGLPSSSGPRPWRDRPDYQEGDAGDYLANAIAAGEPAVDHLYGGELPARLLREPGDPKSGLDSAAAWAVRPFPEPRLFPAVRSTLGRLVAHGTRYGITPGEAWPERDPWTAPTAWSAWSLAALDERRLALRLLADLRRAATPAGALPERVDARTGIPRSTTPLAWSHAFAILALRKLWPNKPHLSAPR
jgi:hypothetical protein